MYKSQQKHKNEVNLYEEDFLHQFLKKQIIPIPKLDENTQIYLADLYGSKLIGGHILASGKFVDDSSILKKKLEEMKRIFEIKNISMMFDTESIAKEFEKEKIKYVILKGMSLNIQNIYEIGIRQFRDIDILVERKDLAKAYLVLRKLGFEYIEKYASDNSKYSSFLHHLPAMKNKNKTIIELHHRVTKKDFFKICPLSSYLIESRVNVNGIFVPNSKYNIIHILYHGIMHDNNNYGTKYLFDLKKFYDLDKELFYQEKQLMNTLGLTKQLENILKFFSEIESTEKFKDCDEKIKIKATRHNTHKKSSNLLIRIKNRLNYIRYIYQTGYSSPKYIFLLVYDLFRSLNTK